MNKIDNIELSGTVSEILPEETINLKNGDRLMKRRFVLENKDKSFNNKVCIELINKNTFLANKLKVGKLASIKCSAYSQQYNDKFYTYLQCFAVN